MLQISQEQLDNISQALGRITSLADAYEKLEARHKALEAEFGKMPRGVSLPGSIWAGAGSKQESEELKRGFLHWMRCVGSKGRVYEDTPDFVKRQLVEGTDADGGYLVPEIFIPELVRLIQERAMMRGLVRRIPMTTDTSNLPSLASGMTVYWPGEVQTITQSDPVFGKVTLNAKTMAALTSASIELTEDAQIELADLLVTLFAEAIADEEDRVILVGNANPFSGILYASGVAQVTMGTGLQDFAEVTFQDVADLIDSVTSKAQRGARFFMHRNITTILRKVRDLNHQYIWSPPTGGLPPTIWGYPYTESDQMPSASATGASTNFLAFGNPNYVYLGDRKRMTVEVSDHVGFKQNERFWKVTERIAVTVAIGAAFGKLRTAA